MAVFRVEKNQNYTVMSNYHLRDTRLTLKAVGLLSKMLSLAEEWEYSTRGLASICKEGVDAIGAALKELEKCGYLVRHQLRDDKGRMLSVQIKTAEARMAEIAVLRTQIVNYAKTREVFTAYKASGYSKKYLAEHEADIILHRAAKKAFNELGMKKLPTIKSLQAEYSQLLSEKKTAYPEYKKARDEMRELLTIQNNVAHILGAEERAAEKEKEQESR